MKGLFCYDQFVQTLKTSRMQAWQGPHWITQRLMAHTTLGQWTLHFWDEREKEGKNRKIVNRKICKLEGKGIRSSGALDFL